MVAIGMLLIWGGYSLSLWGWCLIRDYDVTFGQLVSPTHPYMTGKGDTWPPRALPPTQIWPGKQAPSAAGSGGAAAGGGTPAPDKSGKCPPGFLNVGGKCLSEML